MTFAQSLRDRKLLKGSILTTPSQAIAEALSHTGLDWLFIDREHAPLSPSDAENIIRAVGGRCASVIRVPDQSPTGIKHALDSGCDGVIVPMVNTPNEAKAIVQAARYAPKGQRSVGISRAHKYGLGFPEYMKVANDQTAVIIQIESITAVKVVEEILSVPGIDAAFIGTYDLAASMNKQVQDRDVEDAIDAIFAAGLKKNVPIGMFAANLDAAKAAIKRGATLIAVGIDVGLLVNVAKKIVDMDVPP